MRFSAESNAIGTLLLERGVLTVKQLQEAEQLADSWNISLVQALFSRSWVTPKELYQQLAIYYDLQLVDLDTNKPNWELMRRFDPSAMNQFSTIPIQEVDGVFTVATSRPGPGVLLHIREVYGVSTRIVIAQHLKISAAIQAAFREIHSHEAVYSLAELDPDMSAQQVVTPPQIFVIYLLLSALLLGLALAPIATIILLNVFLTIFYTGNFLFKAILVWVGGSAQEMSSRAIAAEAQTLRTEDLPFYTVLVPMFREPEVLPILTQALRNLDYPLAKLDIKIVLEEGDHQTIQAAEGLDLEGVFEIVRVPASHPQTKPKACNFALRYARGDYLVIFDAEDKPEPDQLRKVIAAFNQSPANTACIQCRLNYYNSRENWLTRMFTLDYSLWFDLMLPGLERLGVPIPLGGTSNHFRMDVLRELNAWDPFNVTEDADLGIRLTQKGYRVGVIDSTTYEEANVSIPNWIRQRSRWIKGYMQTFLVHTRRPFHLWRSIGSAGIFGFIFFVGGTVLSGLLNPIFWTIFLLWLVFDYTGIEGYFPPSVLYLSLINLLAGNGLLIYLTMVAPFRRRWTDLAPWGVTVVGYWVLMTVAAYKALWQLISNPFYWEKTQHGLSKYTAGELAVAKSHQSAASGDSGMGSNA
ncbi:glycosyltransferase family 2 protein [Palleronia pelagia]|uniref:Glycosyltransferase, catalytic subunit of cellulose synthase and poly-beta-1,6-N-acetylglucosamine synthase n=1 Tax=Palleronia pelagia TaxID=387096 RepID=A0A1H8HDK6_9RHOB|nr:glycosyltransferase family 2 protein [Palleronia pelagia]SEN53947.1 Glycosyltransferase, catalytic subunit of cellulose synthase and poly-beta-1,6-N-acetylglucosamine synthase [Palleronia pelagia]